MKGYRKRSAACYLKPENHQLPTHNENWCRRENTDGAARYDADELRDFCAGVFAGLGLEGEDASVASASLVRANLEGTDSHGTSRLARPKAVISPVRRHS